MLFIARDYKGLHLFKGKPRWVNEKGVFVAPRTGRFLTSVSDDTVLDIKVGETTEVLIIMKGKLATLAAAAAGSVKSEKKTVSSRENAKYPRPSARGKPKRRKNRETVKIEEPE